MYSFCKIKASSRHAVLVNAWMLIIPLCIIMTMFVACTNSEDYANPLDSANLRTAGAPDGLTLFPGDRQIRVTWNDTGQEGIKAYRIYRRSSANSEEPFELIATVDAPANEYIDSQNIENDRKGPSGEIIAYEYRISYVDMNDVESPDPTNPPNTTDEPFQLWQTATVTPSVAPLPPVVVLGDPADLRVNLFWENYNYPSDFKLFRLYIAIDKGDEEPLDFSNVKELPSDQFFFIDDNFRQDGISKVYRLAAVDEFGVEGITTIEATSPNLPPAPPKGFQAFYAFRSLFNNKYDVRFVWDENKERDLDGYQIYAKDAQDNYIQRRKLEPNETSVIIASEDPIVIGQDFFFKTYFITAFDDTPNADGQRDESEYVEAEAFYP